ncbi:MAG TPA: hypothetical protein VE420_12065, partial [Gemmatimonadales bacterium]|nr:hypothetical protein [Gemmatimonadales bacterium]
AHLFADDGAAIDVLDDGHSVASSDLCKGPRSPLRMPALYSGLGSLKDQAQVLNSPFLPAIYHPKGWLWDGKNGKQRVRTSA